jgi:hypothetical protein
MSGRCSGLSRQNSTAKRAVLTLQEDISLPLCRRKQTDGKGATARVRASPLQCGCPSLYGPAQHDNWHPYCLSLVPRPMAARRGTTAKGSRTPGRRPCPTAAGTILPRPEPLQSQDAPQRDFKGTRTRTRRKPASRPPRTATQTVGGASVADTDRSPSSDRSARSSTGIKAARNCDFFIRIGHCLSGYRTRASRQPAPCLRAVTGIVKPRT